MDTENCLHHDRLPLELVKTHDGFSRVSEGTEADRVDFVILNAGERRRSAFARPEHEASLQAGSREPSRR